MVNKAIRLECYQNLSSYRKPASIDVQESFKFPPYSTVIGMIHKVCKFKEYKPMKISIQGEYKSSLFNFYNRHFNSKSNIDGIKGIGYVELMVDVDLIIHVVPEDESLFDTILNRLKNPLIYPALGRHEDILRIDKIDSVELEETDTVYIYNDSYIPLKYFSKEDNILGTVYSLNKEFNKTTPNSIRTWKKPIKVKYIKKRIEAIEFENNVYREIGKNAYKKDDKNINLGVFLA